MIVYAESNFLLEWILQQSQAQFVEQILQLAEKKSIQLRIPAIAFAEVRSKLERSGAEDDETLASIERRTGEAGPSEYGKRLAEQYAAVLDALRSKSDEDLRRYELIVRKCLQFAEILILNSTVLIAALDRAALKSHDALILECIVFDAKAGPATDSRLFVEKDKDDFDNPEIRNELNRLSCHCVWDFHSALRRIEAELKSHS